MKSDEERRSNKRVAFVRPIYYFSDKSDGFVKATMLDYSPTGICFQSEPSLTPGDRLYIITEEKSGGNNFNIGSEAIVGKVVWCRQSAGAHRVGVQHIGYPCIGVDKAIATDHVFPLPVPSKNAETFSLQGHTISAY